MNELLALILKPNVVYIDTLPKARLMHKLLLAKVILLTIVFALVLWYFGNWTIPMVAAGLVFMAICIGRAHYKDLQLRKLRFGSY